MTAHASRTGHEARSAAFPLVGASASVGSSPASARASSSWAPTFIGDTVGAPRPPDNSPRAPRGPAPAGTADSLRGREHALLHSWPGPRPRLRRAPPPVGGGRPRADRGHRSRAARPPRHHRGGGPLPRRCGARGRPPGHVGQPHQPPVDREGVPGRPALRRRHRRRGGPGHRDGQAVPAPARALREGRGRGAQPRGQGQPARADGAQPPAGGHAGPRGGAPVRRLRRPPRRGPALPVRRHRRPLRGARDRHHGLRQPARRHRAEARLARGPAARPHHRPGPHRAVHRRRRGLRHGRPRPHPRHLPGRRHHHGRRVPPGRRHRARGALAPAARRVRGQTASPQRGRIA